MSWLILILYSSYVIQMYPTCYLEVNSVLNCSFINYFMMLLADLCWLIFHHSLDPMVSCSKEKWWDWKKKSSQGTICTSTWTTRSLTAEEGIKFCCFLYYSLCSNLCGSISFLVRSKKNDKFLNWKFYQLKLLILFLMTTFYSHRNVMWHA